jgi:hypothetical protein
LKSNARRWRQSPLFGDAPKAPFASRRLSPSFTPNAQHKCSAISVRPTFAGDPPPPPSLPSVLAGYQEQYFELYSAKLRQAAGQLATSMPYFRPRRAPNGNLKSSAPGSSARKQLSCGQVKGRELLLPPDSPIKAAARHGSTVFASLPVNSNNPAPHLMQSKGIAFDADYFYFIQPH